MTSMATVMLESMTPRIPEGYLTLDQAVTKTGVSRETLFRWIKAEKIGSYKQGGIRNTLLKWTELEPHLGPQPKQPPVADL